ncbi:prolyl 3-hydroxylase 2-like isoform X1 [Amblyraja radiata]|uniref:prolyl 3-hydroxylase 2-like isoform X1 n=1 Tax=Amblyraja radiata TaxID=386614 RepID=UPI001402E86C|nr:prolyl 3-hydroxylase 2-like isoform X1 [Amblyraja radiata]
MVSMVSALWALCCGLVAAWGHLTPFDELYEDGVRAYYDSDWPAVVRAMEGAAHSYRERRRLQVGCRLACAARHGVETAGPRVVGSVLRRARCIEVCGQRGLGPASLHRANRDLELEFERRGPYNYLQLAYYKLNEPAKAAAAAHTFFLANPEHMEMRQSLERYKQMEGVGESHFIDLEARPYMEAFDKGLKHYDEEQYSLAISAFEEAMRQFWEAETECRALCQGPQEIEDIEQHRGLHLYEIIAGHYLQVLLCEHDCVRQLSIRAGRISPIHNYLPLHHDFLQYSYYRVGDYAGALAASTSYLLLHPGDPDMLDNTAYYRLELRARGEPTPGPRKDMLDYMERYWLEKEVLLAASAEHDFAYINPVSWTMSGELEEELEISGRRTTGAETLRAPVMPVMQRKRAERASEPEQREGGAVPYSGARVVSDSRQMNGSQRVLMDHVITPIECQQLFLVANSITTAGDGYRGKMSPHTPNERFEGATVYRALTYGVEGRISLRGATLFYEASERARAIIQAYFMLNSTLYFSYTHLVCRTAIEAGQQDNRNDLSHPIHADNCLLDPDAQVCWKEPPAYTHRDYSAILYLNGDFDGGEFIFTEPDAKTVTAAVKPRCGRMVGFSSGGENPHGVMAVTRGQRCAVALWFTLDPHFREQERIKADEAMELISLQQQLDGRVEVNPRDEL